MEKKGLFSFFSGSSGIEQKSSNICSIVQKENYILY